MAADSAPSPSTTTSTSPSGHRSLSTGAVVLLMAVAVAAGLVFRVWGYDWGVDGRLHPDEVGVVGAVLGPADLRGEGLVYPYGALPVLLVRGAAWALSAEGYLGALHTGRVLAALFDTATVLLVALAAARLAGVRSGLLAGALYAFALLPIQQAHFFTSDPFLTTFTTATLLLSLMAAQGRGSAWVAGAGACAGLAVACKASAATVLLLPLAACLLITVRRGEGLRGALGRIALCIGAAFAGLAAGDPFALLHAGEYLSQVAAQAAIQAGAEDVWFTRKYVNTLPVVYPLWQLALLGAGPVVGLAGLLGVDVAVARGLRRRQGDFALLVLGALALFVPVAFLEVKWVRYLLPIVPYLCIFAALFALRVRERLPDWLDQLGARFMVVRSGSRRGENAGVWVLPALMVGSALLCALAVTHIYRVEHTAIKATAWLYERVGPGQRIAVEINDGFAPLATVEHPDPETEFGMIKLRMLADFTSAEASEHLRQGLAEADYLVVGSVRALRTVPNLPWRYPVQRRYYDLLFKGELGFTLAQKAASYPHLLGVQFADDVDWVDSSFTEYDHPTIYIFRKERALSREEWDTLFQEALATAPVPSRRAP